MEGGKEEKREKGWFFDDVIVGAAIIVFAISILIQVPGFYGDVMLFPKIVAIVSLVCGVVVAGIGLFRSGNRSEKKGYVGEGICLAVSIFMFLMMTAAEEIGFFTCLFIICFVINQLIAIFCREAAMKSVIRSLALSVVMCGLIYVVFGLLLGILTPGAF